MNPQPPLMFEDPSPLASMSAAQLNFDPTPQIGVNMAATFGPDAMMNQRVIQDRITLDLTSDTPIPNNQYEYIIRPNIGNTWRDLPLSIYQYMAFKEIHEFTLLAPDEVKGRFRFDIYDYQSESVASDMLYSELSLLTRHEYWDLMAGKTFKFIMTPTMNSYQKKRWWQSGTMGNLNDVFDYTLVLNGVTSDEQVSLDQIFQANLDDSAYAKFRMKIDQNIQWSAAAPTGITIVHSVTLTDVVGWGLKSWPEAENERQPTFVTG